MALVEIVIRTIDQSKGNLNQLAGNLGELALKFVSVGAVAGAAYKVIGDSIKTTLDYANSVRQLSQISGESTENTSRFLQVLDDYKISAADALVATRALTKSGHTPSIETLAKLSDEYLSINSAQEKNEFILKNLGRSGLQWVEVLNKGSKALLAQGDAVDDSLILSQKMVDAARKNEIAVDNWNDAVQGVKISIGNQLLPVMTNFINGMNEGQRAAEIMREKGLNPANMASREYRDALKQAHEEQEASTAAMLRQADAAEELTESLKLTEEQLKAIEEANKAASEDRLSILGAIGNFQALDKSHKKEQAQLLEDITKLEKERAEEAAKGWKSSKEKIEEYDEAIKKNWEQVRTNQEVHHQAQMEIISGLVERKLMQDGLLDDKEFEFLIRKREEWGIYSAEVVELARAAWQEADRLAASVNNIPDNKTISINMISNLPIMSDIYNYTGGGGHGGSGAGGGGGKGKKRDSGGPGMAGQPYIIGTGAQPELFVPSTSGQFIPNADKLGGGGETEKLLKKIANNTITPKQLARALRDALAQGNA